MLVYFVLNVYKKGYCMEVLSCSVIANFFTIAALVVAGTMLYGSTTILIE